MLKPYVFQKKIIKRATPMDWYALFMDMGTGKTLTVINLLRAKWTQAGGLKRTLVFAPIIVLRNWKKEFLLSTQLEAKYIGVVEGTTAKKKLEVINNIQHHILIINYEALRSEDIRLALQAWGPVCVVCDESHRIKNPNPKTKTDFKGTSTEVREISKRSLYRYILTGTPIQNNFLDIFAQYLFLDRGATFGDNFWKFRKKYYINRNAAWQQSGHAAAFPDWQLNESMEPEIKRKLARTSTQMEAKDCVDLPELVPVPVEVPLSTEQQKHYDKLKADLITWLDDQPDNPLMVQNALVKVMRLNEIVSGYMRLDDGTIHSFKENPRLDRLMELIKDMHHKVIVFCIYKENYKQIREACKKHKIKYTEIHGGVKDKEGAIDEFNDKAQVCIANPKSAGEGCNLTVARYSVFYTRDFNAKDFWQSRARNYRAGSIKQHKKITQYHFVSPATIDEHIMQAVKDKQKLAKRLLDVRNLLA